MPSTDPKAALAIPPAILSPARTVLVGEVVRVLGSRAVELRTAGGEVLEARCAQHVSAAWLSAALVAVGPVPVGFVHVSPGTPPFVCTIFDGPEFAEVLADLEILSRNITLRAEGSFEVSATDSVHMRVERSTLKLTPDEVELRGKDVTSRARRTNRIKGGTIRQN